MVFAVVIVLSRDVLETNFIILSHNRFASQKVIYYLEMFALELV